MLFQATHPSPSNATFVICQDPLCTWACFASVSVFLVPVLVICRSRFGEGNGNPLQYSCLENPMGGGAWQAAVHGVGKSRTQNSFSLVVCYAPIMLYSFCPSSEMFGAFKKKCFTLPFKFKKHLVHAHFVKKKKNLQHLNEMLLIVYDL